MIFQSIEDLTEAMADDPQTWAQLYLDAQETIDRVVKLNDAHIHNIAKLEQMLRRERGEVITELTMQ